VTKLILAVDPVRGSRLAGELARADAEVVAVTDAAAFVEGALRPMPRSDEGGSLSAADAVVLESGADILTPALVAACDRSAVRIVALHRTKDDERRAAAFGVVSVPVDADAWTIVDAATGALPAAVSGRGRHEQRRHRVVTVWGAAGAPGRTTIAIELSAALAGEEARDGLVDADTHAPSIAMALGIAEEGPGFAAACRQAERGQLDEGELARICVPVRVGGDRIDVLPGINRPSRWPELGARRVEDALAVCRRWADHVVVDVSSSLERDEEIVSDLIDGPRRNAATLAAVQAADQIVAVVAADPLGVARFLRAHAELRAAIGTTPVVVVANRLRAGALGLDARGQIRRTLERFAGVQDVWFVPQDPRSADAALLAAQPIAAASPRSPLTLAVRRFAAEAIQAEPVPRDDTRRARRPRGAARARPTRPRAAP